LLKLTEKVSSSGNYVTLTIELFLITTFTLDAVKPICIVMNPKAPRTLSVLLNVNQEGFMGVHKENVVPVDNSLCSQKIGMIVGTNQFCVENRGVLKYQKPGSILGTFQSVRGVNRYVLIGIISFYKNGLVVLTNVQNHAYWIMDTVNSLVI